MAADGTLDWDVPPGKWTILRLGYSLTGAKNRPAVPAGLGYEVDKLSRKHMEAYLRGYTRSDRRRARPAVRQEPAATCCIDSWEAGMQNWTEEMIAEFQRAPRLRPDALPARARGPRRRQRRGERPFPVGLPPHARRHVRREPLRA